MNVSPSWRFRPVCLPRSLWALPMLLTLAALLGAGPARAQFISFNTSPTNTVSGQPINSYGSPGVTIRDYDTNEIPIAGASVTVSLVQQSGGPAGTLSTSTSFTGTTDQNGQLTFVGLMIDRTGYYYLTARDNTSGGQGGSYYFYITPGPFSQLVFLQQPVNAPLGFPLNTGTNPRGVVLQAQDAAGNALDNTQPAVSVTVALGSGSGGTLTTQTGASNGTGSTQTATGTTGSNGSIAFNDLNVSPVGTYTLVATGTDTSMPPTTVTVTSKPFAITQYSDGVVTSYQDDGSQGTLRSVLANVPPGATVTFLPSLFDNSAGGSTRTIYSDNVGGEIRISQGVTVVGPPNGVIVDGEDDSHRVFGITGGPVSMSNLTIQNGVAPLSGRFGEGAPFFGQGGGVAVSGSGVLTLTRCMISDNNSDNDGNGNGNGNGGGVYNAGALALVDCTIRNNYTTFDGGGVFSEGATFLVGCAVFNNTANNNGGGGNGGGVFSDGQALTVTSCSFSNNRADQGYSLFNISGTATLTDDILYYGGSNGSNNANGPSEIGGNNLAVTYSDVAGGSGQEDSNGNSLPYPGVGNLFVSPRYNNTNNDLHLSNLSPVIGLGTSNAPGFGAADHDGNLYFNVPSMGAYEGALDETTGTHALWTNPDGRTIVWDLPGQTVSSANGSPANNYLIVGNYGPQDDGTANYTAVSLATTPPNNGFRIIIGGGIGAARPRVVSRSGGASPATSYVLWNAPDGHVMLWGVDDGSGAVTRFTYGPFADDGSGNTIWRATAVSAGGDGGVHILWTNPNGRTILWDVNSFTGKYTVRGNYDGFSDDGTGQTVWKAVAMASGPDGLNHILFNNADGHTLIWNLDQNDEQPAGSGAPSTGSQGTSSTFSTYGVFSDDGTANTLWKAQAISVGPDNFTHLLWTNPDGRTIFWKVNRDGSFGIVDNFGPARDTNGQGSFTAVALATSQDNQSHFAWDSLSGETLFREINQDGTFGDLFFPPFMDDGTGNTIWKTVALSAAVGTLQNNND